MTKIRKMGTGTPEKRLLKDFNQEEGFFTLAKYMTRV